MNRSILDKTINQDNENIHAHLIQLMHWPKQTVSEVAPSRLNHRGNIFLSLCEYHHYPLCTCACEKSHSKIIIDMNLKTLNLQREQINVKIDNQVLINEPFSILLS